jgi:hypothetical protein
MPDRKLIAGGRLKTESWKGNYYLKGSLGKGYSETELAQNLRFLITRVSCVSFLSGALIESVYIGLKMLYHQLNKPTLCVEREFGSSVIGKAAEGSNR